MHRVGFVVLTWNSEKFIFNCLNSIFSVDQKKYLCITVIVDNGSMDRTRENIEIFLNNDNELKRCEVICLGKNYGTTYSRNIGLKRLFEIQKDVDFVCIMDSDAEINENALSTMIGELQEHSEYGIIGPRMYNMQHSYQISGKDFSTFPAKLLKPMPFKKLRQYGEKMEMMVPLEGSGCIRVGFLISACILLRTDVMKEIGYLDEAIFYAPEDLEYCIRCWKRGYEVVLCYDAEIFHYWQRLSRKKFFSRHNFEQLRGLVYVFWKYRYFWSTKKLWRSINIID